MTQQVRFVVIIGVIVFSAGYSILVVKDEGLASAISLGYIAVILTVMLLLRYWRKP